MEKNIENLMHNLPDYITGNLHNDGLRKEIKEEIDINPDFRSEYEDLKSSFTFLGETSLSEPPGFYFNNLLPNINQRIDAMEAGNESFLSGWLGNLLKFAIPALILVVGYLIYSDLSTSNEEILTDENKNMNEQIRENEQNTENNNILSNIEDTLKNNDNTSPVADVSSDQHISNNTTYAATDKITGDGGFTLTSENSDELDEILYDNASYPVSSDDIEQQASEELTQQEQDELLNYMSNAQL